MDRKLPRPLQTFVALYGGWIERLRASPRRETFGARARRLLALLLLDSALLVSIVIGASISLDRAAPELASRAGIPAAVAEGLVIGGAALLCVPFLAGILGLARRLAELLARAAFPARSAQHPDLAAAPRRALLIAIELSILLAVGLPLLAVTQPFVGVSTGLVALGLLVFLLASLWRSAESLEGHVRAGAQAIVEVLAAQSAHGVGAGGADALERVDALLPGLGHLAPIRLAGSSPAVGRTLAELDLRSLTGATVLAIRRGEAGLSVPGASEVLRAGDVLALTGTEEAIEAARVILREAASPEDRSATS